MIKILMKRTKKIVGAIKIKKIEIIKIIKKKYTMAMT